MEMRARLSKLGYWQGTGPHKPYYDGYYGPAKPTPAPIGGPPGPPKLCEDLAAGCDDMKDQCNDKNGGPGRVHEVCAKTCGVCGSPMEWIHYGWTGSTNATYPPFYYQSTIGELEKRKEIAERFVREAGTLQDPNRKGIPDPILRHVAQIAESRPTYPPALPQGADNIDSAIDAMINHKF